MKLEEMLRMVSIVGAAGKMGSGIALLLASEMAKQGLKPENKGFTYRLNLIDINDDALDGLVKYLRTQLVKAGEKGAVELRGLYKDRKDLVENFDIIEQFVNDTTSLIRCGTDLNMTKGSTMIFEAIVENEDIKVDLLKKLDQICGKDAVYFTNTSSIPISVLNKEANLGGRIIGFHFYNPPAIQRLAELISTDQTKPELKELALELAKRLGKRIVPSNDIAGFIGNGHFLRDGLYGIKEARRLSEELGLSGGIYAVNKVSQDLLLRPMGIFQLIDYVGVDVFHCISEVISGYLKENLKDDLLAKMVEKKVFGGQRSDGSQKDGFLKYEKNRPVGVYDIDSGQYKIFDANGWGKEIDQKLGEYPQGIYPWRALLMDPKKEEKFSTYFKNLNSASSLGAKLALGYLKNSKEIGKKLVATKVAASEKDVNDVLLNGFYHLYGPINDYVK